MNTILVALFGYILAKIQTSDPFLFKLGIATVLVFATLEYFGELVVKIVFRLLANRK